MPIKHTRHKTNFAALIILSILWTPITIAEPAGIIAYVSSSIDNKQIRLINPDGSQDRLLWKVPISAGAGDRIGSLSWHPEGTELAFDSGHNWQRSMAIRNIYAISSDGARLRKITNPPGIEGSNNKPTGTVKFWVRGEAEQGDVQIYVEGASEPTKYFAKQAYDYQVTLTVADFGEGVRQYIRLWDPSSIYSSNCRWSEEGWVDIIPGQEVDLDSVPFSYNLVYDRCYRFHSPTWSHDGNHLLYMLGSGYASLENRTLKIRSHTEAGLFGHDILAAGQVHHVKFSPTPSRKNEALYTLISPSYSTLGDSVYLKHTENGTASEKMIGAVIPYSLGSPPSNKVLDIAWLPNGSGFITAQIGEYGNYSAIYLYTFTEKTLSLITYLPNESIGGLAISPDGSFIAFERGQKFAFTSPYRETPCRPCSIWMVNMDGSGLHQLVEDGRAPTWSKIALPVDYSRGDANGDGNINIQDVILSINIILDNGSPIKGSDCNKDGFMNIQDIVCTIDQVLGNQP